MKAGLFLWLVLTTGAWGQGCSQCREEVGQAPKTMQRGYRRGVETLIAAVVCVCGATVVAVRRYR